MVMVLKDMSSATVPRREGKGGRKLQDTCQVLKEFPFDAKRRLFTFYSITFALATVPMRSHRKPQLDLRSFSTIINHFSSTTAQLQRRFFCAVTYSQLSAVCMELSRRRNIYPSSAADCPTIFCSLEVETIWVATITSTVCSSKTLRTYYCAATQYYGQEDTLRSTRLVIRT
jgi:hypothetical protein